LYVDHVESQGCALFERACQLDLEGVVAKRKESLYRAFEKPSRDWIKIKNPDYSQAEGRQELFEGRGLARTDNASRSLSEQ
jgi:bifunctional non-homologous end joining protein LigD